MHSQLQNVLKNQLYKTHPQYSLLVNENKQYHLDESNSLNLDITKTRRKSCEGMMFGYESDKIKIINANYPSFQSQNARLHEGQVGRKIYSQKQIQKVQLRKQKKQLKDQLTPKQFNQSRNEDENPLYIARKEIKNSTNSRISSLKISKMINFDLTNNKDPVSKVACQARGYLPTRIRSNFLSQTYQFSLQTFTREGFSDYCSLQTEETQEQTNNNQTQLKQNELRSSQKVVDFLYQHRLNPHKTITKFIDQQLFIETGDQQREKQVKLGILPLQLNFYQTNLVKKKSNSIFTPVSQNSSQRKKNDCLKVFSSYSKLKAQLLPAKVETPYKFKIKKMKKQFSQHLYEKENNFCHLNTQEPFRSKIQFKNDE